MTFNHDRQRWQRSHELHERHLRLPHAHRQPRPDDGPDLRDRRVRRRSPPDRVELPAHAVRASRPTGRTACPAAATASQTGAEECDCGDDRDRRRRIRRAAGRTTTARTAAARRCASTARTAATASRTARRGVRPRQPDEQRDLRQQDGCAPGCKFPHFCGDAIVDEAEGEQCDLGHRRTACRWVRRASIDCKVCIDCQ